MPDQRSPRVRCEAVDGIERFSACHKNVDPIAQTPRATGAATADMDAALSKLMGRRFIVKLTSVTNS